MNLEYRIFFYNFENRIKKLKKWTPNILLEHINFFFNRIIVEFSFSKQKCFFIGIKSQKQI